MKVYIGGGWNNLFILWSRNYGLCLCLPFVHLEFGHDVFEEGFHQNTRFMLGILGSYLFWNPFGYKSGIDLHQLWHGALIEEDVPCGDIETIHTVDGTYRLQPSLRVERYTRSKKRRIIDNMCIVHEIPEIYMETLRVSMGHSMKGGPPSEVIGRIIGVHKLLKDTRTMLVDNTADHRT